MENNSTLGTQDNPVITDTAELSAGTAVVIATAASAIIISQALMRTWRSLSLGKLHSLLLARIHLLVLALGAVSTVGILGTEFWFPDDARALGGLQPLIGVLSPFVFFLSRQLDTNTSSTNGPSRIRFISWLFLSPVNVIVMVPAIGLSAACTWLMVRSKAWDVLALAASLLIAVITETDPPLHHAWNGTGARWQWGRLLPSPVRGPAWRFVLGRAEVGDSDESEVVMEVDSMEVPLNDSTGKIGSLVDEEEILSDTAIATSIQDNGVLNSLSLFYNYASTVWGKIIHGAKRGTESEGKALDEAASGAFLLISSLLKEALEGGNRIGADVWLLYAILNHRLNAESIEFVELRENLNVPFSASIREWKNSFVSMLLGRERTTGILVRDISEVSDNEEDIENPEITETEDSVRSNLPARNLETQPSKEYTRKEHQNDDDADDDDEIETENAVESTRLSTETAQGANSQNSESTNAKRGHQKKPRYVLKMFQAVDILETPPQDSDPILWKEWIFESLENLYSASLAVCKEDWNIVGKKLGSTLPATFKEYIGQDGMVELDSEITNMLSSPRHVTSDVVPYNSTQADEIDIKTTVEEATMKVVEEEAWSYIMMCLARMHIVSNPAGGFQFECAGIDVISVDLNGRVIAQNMAKKVLLAQIGLWSYVALGQTVSALLARG